MVWLGFDRGARDRLKRVIRTIALWLLPWAIASLDPARLSGQTVPAPLRRDLSLKGGQRETLELGPVKSGLTYRLLISLANADLRSEDRLRVELRCAGSVRLTKDLHAGDPDGYFPFRPRQNGQVSLSLFRSEAGHAGRLDARVDWCELNLSPADRSAIEAEPNDTWQEASELKLGRDVYGTADDVDYLDNTAEGTAGLDWFRFEVAQDREILVYFQLDLLDRDVSANLRVYTVDSATGRVLPYLKGKDPMEIVHDRERERYSKHISRTFSRGTYYLEVNANHPDYILRTRVLPVPPYKDPAQAVEAGMHYIINVGDAWFAQIPREGNIYVRAANMHDTATRCTACHPSSFSTEANLVAHRNGYPIRSKSNFQYVIDRLYNSITPLYGDDGLYWQRFIAIPLQAQGKQGGILLDFERQVSGRPTRTVERFGPFLQKAWESRTELPPDEQNGVVPADSKFGFSWRDWRVLSELAQRTGKAELAKAADRIAAILATRAADKRIETLQDRIHRIYAWWLLDKAKFANKLKRETGALLSLQNADGGWYESDSGPGPSAVYTTGQLVWTLLRTGVPRDHPAIAQALRYLLAQQQDFGGWFQTTTHENFRTPMRETRYAVMALAEAFPRPGAPLDGWGNRDEGPARPPRTDTLLHTLDDLENLWQVPPAHQAQITGAVTPLLDHPEPLVRAAAAACLGRVGDQSSVAPLARRLADPSKIVWRAAAWALRRLGNQAIGQGAITAALSSPDPGARRGAVRVFAYHFYGMDERDDVAARLLELTRDPDLWTRLQALKTLRQWFYRTSDTSLKRRIVDTYLARMAEPDAAVVRKNLSEGLYILLDENLGGGVSLQKNIAALPEAMRSRILEARRILERDVLLSPVLTALKQGNDQKRTGVLAGFDGSFFKGRFYARQPEAMIDVGNDREFGFLFEPPLETIEATFAPLLAAQLDPVPRRQALQLARFFRLPGRTADSSVQLALLSKLGDPDAEVRSVARAIVSDELELKSTELDPAKCALVLAALRGTSAERQAILQMIGRNEHLAARPEVRAAVRALIENNEPLANLLPLLRSDFVRDAELVSFVLHDWPRLEPSQRLEAIAALLTRPSLVDLAEPREPVMQVLRRAVNDPSPAVRDRTLRGVNALPKLWAGKGSTPLLLAALADDTPPLRRLGLNLADSKPSFWSRPDALEYLKRLLVDPDARVRLAALSTVEQYRLIPQELALARRVKVLEADPALARRAAAVLVSQGVEPRNFAPDVTLGRPRLLSFSTFRRTVNPLFYQPGEDNYACAHCHANHTILRIAERGSTQNLTAEQLMINYNSALKVVNLGEPEASLMLRKPLSPHGQGAPDAASPTGLTHVGGPRWAGTDHPAYRAILDWVRDAARAATVQAGAQTYATDSYAPGYEPAQAGDGDLATIWHTEFVGAAPGYPHELVLDLSEARAVEGLLYVPRQDSPNGRVRDFEIRISGDGKAWSAPLVSGTWANDPTFKYVALPGKPARFVQLRGLSEVEGRPFMSAAEVTVESTPIPDRPAARR
jgi:HEAT repeat protein